MAYEGRRISLRPEAIDEHKTNMAYKGKKKSLITVTLDKHISNEEKNPIEYARVHTHNRYSISCYAQEVLKIIKKEKKN